MEYIVETTAKCNLYCPMCPRETHKQPKADMADEIFERLVRESGESAEHMMLIGLGEPFMDRKIFDRIEYCERHNISTLLSTNGTFFDEKTCARLLDTPLEHITLSFDGATKESFEYYRKGANFEKVRDNFVRFARMKQERGAKVQVVVQMVRMERNAGEVDDFVRFWSAVDGRGSGAHQGRRDQRAAAGNAARGRGLEASVPLFVARSDVREAEWRRVRVLPELYAGWRVRWEIWSRSRSPRSGIRMQMQRMRELHATGRAGEIDVCARCCTTIPSGALVAGSLLLHGRTVRRLLPWVERLVYFSKLPRIAADAPAQARARAGTGTDRSQFDGKTRRTRSVKRASLRTLSAQGSILRYSSQAEWSS